MARRPNSGSSSSLSDESEISPSLITHCCKLERKTIIVIVIIISTLLHHGSRARSLSLSISYNTFSVALTSLLADLYMLFMFTHIHTVTSFVCVRQRVSKQKIIRCEFSNAVNVWKTNDTLRKWLWIRCLMWFFSQARCYIYFNAFPHFSWNTSIPRCI